MITDIQNSNETLIDENETVQDSSNLDPINDSTNTSSIHNNKEIAEDCLDDTDEAKEDTNNGSDADDVNNPDNPADDDLEDDPADNDPVDDDPDYRNPEEEQSPSLRAKNQPKELKKVLHHKIIH